RTPNPMPPPTSAMTVPDVVDTELPMTSSSRTTTCGSAADSADSTNLFIEMTTRAVAKNTQPDQSFATIVATHNTMKPRNRLVLANNRCLLNRSSSTPANGPTMEYGKNST